jgi:protein HIRA/HIR1
LKLDGNVIATANGESAGVWVAPILYRDNWQSSVCFVGHEAPIECSAFNPLLYSTTDPKTGMVTQNAVCAIGSQDSGISVWWSGSSRAIVSAQQIFSHSVLDLAW